jgi:polar amino acid transport system substrate-binding protein
MMRVVGRRLLLACLLVGGSVAHAAEGPDCSRPYSLGLHEHGLLYAGQTGEGIDKDVADELARRSGCRIAVSVMPRSRIWQLIESGALDFSLSGITNEAREKYASFAWYFSNRYYLLVRKDASVRTHADLVDNPRLQLGVIRSFRYSPTANRMVDQLDAQQRVSYASQLDALFEILLQNRVQAMIIEPFDYPTITSGRLREETTILEFADPPVPHGLIMSKKALPPAQQQAWRGVVDAMRRDGTMQRIFEKYFKPELAREMTQF